jgi:hypothetical protein
MSRHGAEFADLEPRNSRGTFTVAPILLSPVAALPDINNATIQQVTPNNAFRLGQQIFFWVGIFNEAVDGNYLDRIKLKLWWARNNQEYRQAGAINGDLGAADSYLPIDSQVFAGSGLADNRYIWIPSTSRLQVTPFDGPTPPAASSPNNDGIMLDDVWVFDLQDATAAAYTDTFQTGQTPSRWGVFMYPAMGYALGLTFEPSFVEGDLPVTISLSWTVGTLGGSNYQESIG